jgi:hypothetical protein
MAGRLWRVADSRGPLPPAMMKTAVAIARPGRAGVDKAGQKGGSRGAPPRGQASQPGPARDPAPHRPRPSPGHAPATLRRSACRR